MRIETIHLNMKMVALFPVYPDTLPAAGAECAHQR